MNKYRTLLTLLLSSLAACLCHAQSAATKPEVQTEIEAMRLRVQNDGENAYFQFSEAVVLSATNMRVECDTLEVFATRQAENQENIGKYGAIREIIASGNVRIVQAERTATCQKAVVQPNQERIVLSGNPVVEQPGGRVITYNPQDEIILDRGNGRIFIESKGPRKIRLTSSAISDLGFEHQGPVPTPETLEEKTEQADETNAEAPASDSSVGEEEAENANPPTAEE